MATLIPLMDKIKDIKESLYPDLRYVFDDLSAINASSANDYPCILVKPPQSVFDRQMEYQIYSMDMFVFNVENSDDVKHWTEKWDECQDILVAIIKNLFTNTSTHVLVGENVKVSLGHYQNNDKLIGARAEFNLRVYYGC